MMKNQEILEILKTDGYCKIPAFFSKDEICSIKKSLKSIYDQINTGDQIDIPGNITPNSYSTGKSIRIYPPISYQFFPEIRRFHEKWLTDLTDDFFDGCNQKGLQVFSSYEYIQASNVSELPRNSYMHVDPYHALKFISHMEDANEINGALQVIPGTCWIGEKIRQENDINTLLNSDAYTFLKSKYYDKSLEEKITYIDSTMGELIILNTDVVHCGGVLKESGAERTSINYHNRK